MIMNSKKIVIIGAGFAGLASAALLAKDGHEVLVIEKNDMSGGRARVWKESGFSFDMGPSWYLMPDAFEKFFAKFNKKPEDLYKLIRLDPSYRIFFGPNDILDIKASLDENIKLFESLETGAGQKLVEYLEQARYQYDVSMSQFLYKNFKSVFDFFNKRMMDEGRKLHVFENLDKFTKRFFKNERLRKVLQYSMVFLGGAPSNTPALYSVINHADFNLGVWYPYGGFSSVAIAIQKLAESYGAKFVFNSEVKEIVVEDGVAKKVITTDSGYDADVVVGNGDYHHIETALLPKKYQSYSTRYWKKRTMAPSAFILYLGLNKKLSNLKHHNLMLSNDWEKHFNAIFDNPSWPTEPSYYVCAPAQTDASVAPEGKENLFVLVPIASGLSETSEFREEYAQKIISHMENEIGETFADSIIVKRIFTGVDFAKDYNAFQGTALGLSHTLFQTAMLRPRMKSKKVANLYFAGQYTQPGIGVPMALISGELTHKNISEDNEQNK